MPGTYQDPHQISTDLEPVNMALKRRFCQEIRAIAPVSGIPGFYDTGACCAEFDLWEANNAATQMTAHVCKK